ncbi:MULTISPECIES: MATE family efflux transporter [Helcococcus]|uniref:Probable multidrug resistance protein NorM n=1 Tax=Helcococcus bovis TaxID=3153252 RepID=A0ABW9F7G1_9FIRM
MNKKLFFSDKTFLRMMLSVALPVSIQFLISTSINMADTVMISSLGGSEIAAVGLVNQFVFFFFVACFGVCSTGSVFFAQYFGDKDINSVRKYLTIIMQFSILIGVIFTVFSLLYPYQIMRILIPDESVINVGISYLRLISLTFLITAISQCFNTVLRSCNRAKEPLLVSIVSFFVNVFFNYMFIFGKFGAPAMGVSGAALGTIIARIVEIVLLTLMILRHKPGVHLLTPTNLLKFESVRIKKYFEIGTTIILAEILWALGQLLFAIAYARIGKDATASIQLTNTIQNIFFIIVNAVNTSATVLIGQTLGAGKIEKADRYAKYFLQITSTLGFISLSILAGLPHLLMKIYTNIEPHIYAMAISLLIIRGLFIPFRFLNGMLYTGIFRAGGETKIPFLIELSTMWGFAIPMSFIGVLFLKWRIEWIFMIVSLEEFIKFFLILPLYKKKRWLNNLTN